MRDQGASDALRQCHVGQGERGTSVAHSQRHLVGIVPVSSVVAGSSCGARPQTVLPAAARYCAYIPERAEFGYAGCTIVKPLWMLEESQRQNSQRM